MASPESSQIAPSAHLATGRASPHPYGVTIGVGGSTKAEALDRLSIMTEGVQPIGLDEYRARVERAARLMRKQELDAVYLHAGTNLAYFTGTRWYPSERLVGALLGADGSLRYVAPHFELGTLKGYMVVEGAVHTWHEHESPYALIDSLLPADARLGIDEATPFFISEGIRDAGPSRRLINAKPVTAGCRMHKSAAELALMQRAKDMTLEVHKAAASILRPGMTTAEVTTFIDEAHRKVGARGSSFCIVLFGPDSAFPHGVKTPKALEDGDVVLIDTGCLQENYNSDITRTYVFGEATPRQREVWEVEKRAQAAGFAAAQLGVPCGEVDRAARLVIEEAGFGPEYGLPGLPHRTGHGCGLDIHEWPYLVRNDTTPLAPGMCFSNEPMLCVPGEFGVRLEDHFYMSEAGPRWFTQPSHSIDDPFGLST